MSFLWDDNINAPPLWHNGPIPGAFFHLPGYTMPSNPARPVRNYGEHSQIAITTTTTVLGLKFDKGCVVAADMLGSYGSLARFRNCSRLVNLNGNTLIGCGGDYADYQYLKDIINMKILSEKCQDDGFVLTARSMFCWITRVLYNKRTKLDPLWNNYIVAGIEKNCPFMGCIDKIGTAYEDAAIATGLGTHIAAPLLRNAVSKGLPNEQSAINSILKCIEVLYYRDSRAYPRFQLGVVTKHGVNISEPKTIKSDWNIAKLIVSR